MREDVGDHPGKPAEPMAAARKQLDRILESATFCSAPGLSKFLRHLVEQAIDGNSAPLKEYSVGVEVFGRGSSFDPRIDTIVRVQARKLRAKLSEYYATEGHADAILIEVPKGQYRATLRQAEQEDAAGEYPSIPVRRKSTDRGDHVPVWSSLPAARTPLIGRDKEVEAVTRMLLSAEVRLLTLSGAGGSGKTRLAIEVASGLTSQFSGGIWFIPLAGISDPGMVASTIGQAVPLRNVAAGDYQIGLKGPMLLVIDNAEHLIEAAPLFGQLLDATNALKILVTSRSILHVYGEHQFSVLPLPTPDLNRLPPADSLRENAAVELFVQRAIAADSGFELNTSNHRAVAEICVRLDGLPLAIELAAPAIRMLPPAAILRRLERSLDLLTGGARDLHSRQQTLRSTVAWSYALLNPFEQRLFRRLAVFTGGCTLESVEAVCNTRRDLGGDALTGLSSLVDKSLLQQGEDRALEPRFVMLESIRQYAFERLTESGEEVQTRRSHAAYALVLAEEPQHHGAQFISEWVEQCDAEHDNLRAALDWLVATDHGEWALRLGVALFQFWEAKEYLSEGRQRLLSILRMKSAAAATGARARVSFCAAVFMAAQGDYDAAFRLFDDARRLYAELDDRKGIAAAVSALGTNRRLRGDLSSGRVWLEQALGMYRVLGDRPGIAGAATNLADVLNAQGEHGAARALMQEALEIFRQLGDSSGIAWSLNRLGDIAYQEEGGELNEARRLYGEAAEIFRAIGDRWGMARSYADLAFVVLPGQQRGACQQSELLQARDLFVHSLKTLLTLRHTRGMARVFEGLACLAIETEDFERALTLAGVAAGLRDALGSAPSANEKSTLEQKLQAAWTNLDTSCARNMWSHGSGMPLEDAIRYALESPKDPDRAAAMRK
jgi:predicted ATPase